MPAVKKSAAKKATAKTTPVLYPQVTEAMHQALAAGRYFRLGQIATTYSEFLNAGDAGKHAVEKRRWQELKLIVGIEFAHDVEAAAKKKHDALMAAGREGKYTKDELTDALNKLSERTQRARQKALAAANWTDR